SINSKANAMTVYFGEGQLFFVYSVNGKAHSPIPLTAAKQDVFGVAINENNVSEVVYFDELTLTAANINVETLGVFQPIATFAEKTKLKSIQVVVNASGNLALIGEAIENDAS